MTPPTAAQRAWAARQRRRAAEREERKQQNRQALDLIPRVERGVVRVDTPAEYEGERKE